MVHPFRNSLIQRRGAGFSVRYGVVLLMAVAIVMGHAQTSHASCGDWLDETKHEAAASDAVPLGLPCQCQGPMCEDGNPGQDPLSTPDFEFNPQRDFATLRERMGCHAPDMSWKLLTGRAVERDGFPDTIDRPPRNA